jgi:hypothetical protein
MSKSNYPFKQVEALREVIAEARGYAETDDSSEGVDAHVSVERAESALGSIDSLLLVLDDIVSRWRNAGGAGVATGNYAHEQMRGVNEVWARFERSNLPSRASLYPAAEEEQEGEWVNREGMPEFNGSFQ